MRYYFINQEMEEICFDVETLRPEDGLRVLEFTLEGEKTRLYLRPMGGKHYYSFDKLSWNKLPALGVNEVLVSNTETLRVYRGFKPSGLNAGGAGALVTQMPGKVVKILKRDGDSVVKGETVLILEAMKMENEIKAGTDGKIKGINVKEGQALEAGYLLMEIEE